MAQAPRLQQLASSDASWSPFRSQRFARDACEFARIPPLPFARYQYAAFNGDSVVYHDDFGDYSTNEPIMDGTATMTRLMAALASPPPRLQRPPRAGRAPAAPTARSPRP